MKLPQISSVGCGLVFTALALQAGAALAQATPQKVVSRDELRVCMNSEVDLGKRRKVMDERAAKHEEQAKSMKDDLAALEKEGKELEKEQKPMDRFQRKVRQHNAKAEEAMKVEKVLLDDWQALNNDLTAYNKNCGSISFKLEDRQAILKEREAAPKQ